VVASLNHPHICTLYDIGQQDGIDYLVMEFLEGQTLAQRLLKGPLPLEQVLQYAIEIADALDKAHRKGVTHRDLKPGNVMLTKAGTKLLDFGLAKLRHETAPANISLSKLSTEDAITAQGTILGMLQYMAPEQLEAKQADARTDIFAFSVVVYEMATGKKAFEGKSQASLIAAILEREPPAMSSLQPMTPPQLDRVVKKCLAKEPQKRWQAASDVCDELKWIAEGGSQVMSVPTAAPKAIRVFGRQTLIISVGTLLLGAAISGIAIWNLKPSLPRPVSRLTITLPPGQQLAGLDLGPAVALSPDGTHLAYAAIQGGSRHIYLRAMDSLEAKPIPGTEGAVNPFFSPDGQSLGFFADGKLKRVSVNGGAVLILGNAAVPRGASWGNQGTIALAPLSAGTLQQVSDSGGAPQTLTRFEKGEIGHRWPEFLPDGKAILFTTSSTGFFTNPKVAIQSLGTGERRNLIPGATEPRYAPSGHLVYAQGATLMAVPFDPQRLTATGAAVPMVDGVLQSLTTGAAQYSFSATGSLVYVPGSVQGTQRRLVWVSGNGAEQPLAAPTHAYQYARLSPDGRRVAVAIAEQGVQLWLYDLFRETLTRFTFEGDANSYPTWTPDGKRIAFTSSKEGRQELFWQLADGSGGLERLTTSEYADYPGSWSPDGKLLAFGELNPITASDIWVLRLGDPWPRSGQVPSADSGQARKAQPFLQTPFYEGAAQFSPDGHWLAYASNESGPFEVYVQPYPGPGGKWQILTEGGNEPVWNRNGRELFYRSGSKMMAVDIATQPGFAAGTPDAL
jgi:Tol biopolymer transport system component